MCDTIVKVLYVFACVSGIFPKILRPTQIIMKLGESTLYFNIFKTDKDKCFLIAVLLPGYLTMDMKRAR